MIDYLNIATGTEHSSTNTDGDFNVPILAPRASEAAVAAGERISRRDEAVATGANAQSPNVTTASASGQNRTQAYELINAAALETSLQNSGGISSQRNSNAGQSLFPRNRSSLGYRSLR